MSDIKTLKMYVKNRRLPEVLKLGTVPLDWIASFKSLADSLPNTSDVALHQRVEQNITGTEIVDYDALTEFYNQRYLTDVELPVEIKKLQGVHHLRFGVLQKGATIPFHLDEPFTLRFLCMVSGTHTFYVETGSAYEMQPGELWFINGSFKHSIKNTSTHDRIVLLGKFEHCEYNTRIINELL
jgi:quercetin dioxygenase-like cupin family protein